MPSEVLAHDELPAYAVRHQVTELVGVAESVAEIEFVRRIVAIGNG